MGGLGMGGLQMGGGRRALWGWASQLPAAMIEVGVWLPVAAIAKVSAGGRQAETMGRKWRRRGRDCHRLAWPKFG